MQFIRPIRIIHGGNIVGNGGVVNPVVFLYTTRMSKLMPETVGGLNIETFLKRYGEIVWDSDWMDDFPLMMYCSIEGAHDRDVMITGTGSTEEEALFDILDELHNVLFSTTLEIEYEKSRRVVDG